MHRILILAVLVALSVIAGRADAWNAKTHSRLVETAVSIAQHPPLQTVLPPPTNVSQIDWGIYLGLVAAADDELVKLQTGLPGSLPAGHIAVVPGAGQGELYPFNDSPDTPEHEAEHCPFWSDDNLDNIGLIRIQDFKYEPSFVADPCGIKPLPLGMPTSDAVLQKVLGFQAQYPDSLYADSVLWHRPTNAGPWGWLKEAASKAYVFGATALVAPFKCAWDAIFGDGCDLGSAQDLANKYNPVDYVEGWLPGFGDVRGSEYVGLWHFIDIDASSNDFNAIRGMYYPEAGPSYPGAIDISIMAAADLTGLSLNAGESDGDDHYGQHDAVSRGLPAWQSHTIGHLEFSPLDNLARYGWDKFKSSGHTNAGGLAWPLHALGDGVEPHHVVGTSSWGHRPLEDAVDSQLELILPVGPPANPTGEDYEQRQRILVRSYGWWKSLHDSGGNLQALIESLAFEARQQVKSDGDWAYEDLSSVEYLIPGNGAEITFYSKRPQAKKLIELSAAVTLGFLVYVSEGVVDPGFNPASKCPLGTHYEINNGCQPGPGTTPPAPGPLPGVCWSGGICLPPDSGTCTFPCSTQADCPAFHTCVGSCCIGDIK